MDIQEVMKVLHQFSAERDWEKYHTPENLAKSISIEAGELLECFQWSSEPEDFQAVKEELADVLSYALMLCQKLNLDPAQIILEKMEQNRNKYPIEKAKGKATKYDKLQGDLLKKFQNKTFLYPYKISKTQGISQL